MVTFEVNGRPYWGVPGREFQVPGGMPIKNLKVVFPEPYELAWWMAAGSLIHGSREELLDSVSLFSNTLAIPIVWAGHLTVPKSSQWYSITVIPPPGSKMGTSATDSSKQCIEARPAEFVTLRAAAKLKNSAVFAWSNGLQHIKSPLAVVRPFGEYNLSICTREEFERLKLNLVDILLEQIQGGHALASNSHRYGGCFSFSLRLAPGEPASFTASVSPESEFVRWEFYRRDESQPFLMVDKKRVDLYWNQETNAVARVVTRPKDEYKLLLETKVADSDDPFDPATPGYDCPGYVVVESAAWFYHGPKRYYPKDGWVRLRPVANPGYRFVKWETSEDVTGITLGGWWLLPSPPMAINGVKDKEIAVCMQGDTEITAVFEFAPNPVVSRENGTITQCDKEDDKDWLKEAGYVDGDDITRWVKTEAYPGEIFKLRATDPELACMAGTPIDFSWKWEQEGDFIKGNVQQDSSSDAGSFPNDICYVETLNEYTPTLSNPPGQIDLPYGIVRIHEAGNSRILKTIIVKYIQVKEYQLDVLKHELLAKSDEDIKNWFSEVTNEIFLLDRYPEDGSIKDRYNDDRDVNCPIALLLGRFKSFSDRHVDANPEHTFLIIESEDEWDAITGKTRPWVIPIWIGPNDEIDYRSFDIIMVESLFGGTRGGVVKRAPGYGKYDVFILMGTTHDDVPRTVAHENGHYIGGLKDRYYCAICKLTFGACRCACANCGNVRKDCLCSTAATKLPEVVNDPDFSNNLMGMGPGNYALNADQVNQLLNR